MKRKEKYSFGKYGEIHVYNLGFSFKSVIADFLQKVKEIIKK